MTSPGDGLQSRREQLLRQCGLERRSLQASLDLIGASADRVDGGLNLVRRLATPPVLLAGGMAAVLLLGRRRTRRGLAAGISLMGLIFRSRSARDLLAGLVGGSHVVRRSR